LLQIGEQLALLKDGMTSCWRNAQKCSSALEGHYVPKTMVRVPA